jgi:hypothetical protein
MTPLVIACLVVAAAITGAALHEAQLRLERWDHERHAED